MGSLMARAVVDLRAVVDVDTLVDGRVPVRADAVRAIMRGLAYPIDRIDPRGLHVQGGHFVDPVDFSDIEFGRSVTFDDCALTAGLTADRAVLHRLVFTGGTRMEATPSTGSALSAERLRVVHQLQFSETTVHGGVRLVDSHVGLLDCADGNFTSQDGSALRADGLTVDSNMVLAGKFAGAGEDGVVRLVGAHVGGQLDCGGGELASPDGPALHADGVTVDSDVFLSGTFAGAGENGVVRLVDAHLGGQIDCFGGKFTSPDGPALDADGVTVSGIVFLAGMFVGAGERGVVRLLGAHLGGQLTCSGGQFTSPDGPVLHADGVTADSDVLLAGRFAGAGETGVVRLVDALVGGQLDCTGGELTSTNGPALNADGVTVGGIAFLTGRFAGAGEYGVARLLGAHLGGQFICTGGELTSPDGPALVADNLTVASVVMLTGTFAGAGEDGVVRLPSAHVGGQLNCITGKFTSPDGPSLVADNLTADNNVSLVGSFAGAGKLGVVRLPGAQIRGQLTITGRGALTSDDSPALLLDDASVQGLLTVSSDLPSTSTPAGWLSVDGLTYAGLPKVLTGPGQSPVGSEAWDGLLREHTSGYAAQPWQQVAAAHRAAGHEADAKRVLVAQQDDRRARVVPRRSVRYWLLGFTKALTGYGYHTSRTVWWLLGLVVVSVLFALFVAPLVHPPESDTPGDGCATVERVGLGLEWALPIVKTNASDTCVIDTTTASGQWATVGSWGFQAGGWALATLVVAGYTGIVRRL